MEGGREGATIDRFHCIGKGGGNRRGKGGATDEGKEGVTDKGKEGVTDEERRRETSQAYPEPHSKARVDVFC